MELKTVRFDESVKGAGEWSSKYRKKQRGKMASMSFPGISY
jgi:hypothetical protein